MKIDYLKGGDEKEMREEWKLILKKGVPPLTEV